MNPPVVSVIMPVYNSEKYLNEAIESILSQTYTDFEFLIFDDGSKDESSKIIEKFGKIDSRIKYFISKKNIGHIYHLNDGINKARGMYLARMDSDDISMPDRLSKQVEFMNNNSSVMALGSSTLVIDKEGSELYLTENVTTTSEILWISFFTNPLAHPTMMLRTEIFKKIGYYDENKFPAEDFDLWLRILKTNNIASLPNHLLKYRLHDKSISNIKKEIQEKLSKSLLINYWRDMLGEELTMEHAAFLSGFHKGYDALDPIEALSLFRKLMTLFKYHRNRFGKDSKLIFNDFFGKLIYLSTKIRRYSSFRFLLVFGFLLARFPTKTITFILNGRK